MAIQAAKKGIIAQGPIGQARRWLGYEIPKRKPDSLAFAFAIVCKGKYGLTEDEVRAELYTTGIFRQTIDHS